MSALIALIILFIVGLCVRAYVSPATSFKSGIEISAPSDDVWFFLVSEDKRTSWQTGVRTVVSLMGEDLMVGSRSIIIKKIGSDQWEIEEEVIDFLYGKTLVVVHSTEEYVEDIVILLEQKEGLTVLSYSSNKVYNKYMKNVLAPWSAYKDKQVLTHSLKALKHQIESFRP
jgi:hypothetical protein